MAALVILAALPACRKKEEKPKSARKQREEIIEQAGTERAAISRFAEALRGAIRWEQAQALPAASGERLALAREMVKRMEQIPVASLPADLSQAWREMLGAWRSLAQADSPDAAVIEQGAAAAKKLNEALAAHDVPDIRF